MTGFQKVIGPGLLAAAFLAAFVFTATANSYYVFIMATLAIIAGIVLGYTIWGQQVYATGGNLRAAQYAGINTDRVRTLSLVFSALCAACAGIIYIAFFRSFIPTAGQFRELDGIASVIIGGGSIFGGHGTIIGALAGAAVITLLRALLSLQVIGADGSSFVLPQHWVRQANILGAWRARFTRREGTSAETAHA